MNRLMKPDRLDLDPSVSAAKEWRHWRRKFDNFIIECGIDPVPNKHRIITNPISANVYEHVEDCTDFQSVIDTLDNLLVKSHNVMFDLHLLSTRRQQSGETLDQFLQYLRKLSKDCKFKAVTAEQYREESVCDAFINGFFSPAIRQRLLESDTLSLQIAYDKANSLDLAQKNADTYSMWYQDKYPGQIPPDKYSPDKYPRTYTRWTITPVPNTPRTYTHQNYQKRNIGNKNDSYRKIKVHLLIILFCQYLYTYYKHTYSKYLSWYFTKIVKNDVL